MNLMAVSGYSWTLVDHCYIEGLFSMIHIKAWHSFLTKLGVLDFLAIDERTITFNIAQIVSTHVIKCFAKE